MIDNSTRALHQALDLLVAVCQSSGLTISECAKETGIPIDSAQRLLVALSQRGLIRVDSDNKFRSSHLMMRLGVASLGQGNLVWMANAPMRQIVKTTGESVYLAVEGSADTAMYIHLIEGSHTVQHVNWVGRTVPLTGSAVGAALLGEIDMGDYLVVQGGVESDVTAIAAPVEIGAGIRAALNLVVPSYRITEQQADVYGTVLAHEATELSHLFTGGKQ